MSGLREWNPKACRLSGWNFVLMLTDSVLRS